jgi:hypothetical protein
MATSPTAKAYGAASIPTFPGSRPPRTAPAPPKFLVISDGSGNETKVEVKPRAYNDNTDGMHPLQMKKPDFPVTETRYTMAQPPAKDFGQPPHRFRRAVDSRAEGKTQEFKDMRFAGTSYTKTPNAPNRGYTARPMNPTVPRPFMPLSAQAFSGSQALANRTANGAILGSLSTKRYVDSEHVPYLPPDIPVGPDNPSKDLNETWSAHWDDEVSFTL